jgi:hypothetical protein
MVVPLSTFADQDVLKVITENEEKQSEERKLNEAKRAAVLAAEKEARTEVAQAETAADKVEGPVATKNQDIPGADPVAGDAGANPMSIESVHQGFLCDGCRVSCSHRNLPIYN